MRFKDFIKFLCGLLVAFLLIAIGVVGIRAKIDSANILVAGIFVGGGLFLFLRIGHRLLKKLGVFNK